MQEEQKLEPELPATRRKVFFGLFVFPMLIAVTMAILLSGVVLLTKEDESPESLITAIKTGAPSKRWQKAFELSNELNRPDPMIRGSGVMKEAIHILQESEQYDARTRGYMALALSRFDEPEAREALIKALSKIDKKEDAQAAIFIMWAIGNLKLKSAAGEVERFLKSEDADLRKTAAYVLGAIEAEGARSGLKGLLEDPVPDVRWNAALALARLGDGAGESILMQMLDRDRLTRIEQLSPAAIEKAMINAVKGVAILKMSAAEPVLKQLSDTDPSLKVREAALAALQAIG